MAFIGTVKGVTSVLGRMKQQQLRHSQGFERGLVKAGLFLKAQSMKQVPVDTGVLRASGSQYPKKTGSGMATRVQVGYDANYAIFVHENLDAAHGEAFNRKHAEEIAAHLEHSRGPGQKAKFLEDPLRDVNNRRKMRSLIREEMAK